MYLIRLLGNLQDLKIKLIERQNPPAFVDHAIIRTKHLNQNILRTAKHNTAHR